MSPHDEDVVDLTLDSSEDDRPTRPPKRQRRASPADSGDVQLVEEAPQQQEQRPEQLDEDLEVLGTRGDGKRRRPGWRCILAAQRCRKLLPLGHLDTTRRVLPAICVAAVSLPAWLHHHFCLDRLLQNAPAPICCLGLLPPHSAHEPPCLAVWNKSLPHTRDLCGKMPFDVERSLANARHCDKVGRWVRCIWRSLAAQAL